ncbi:MAG: DUF3883 domain-containing protein [Candidatus Kapaibacterium sp.]
MNDNHKLPFFTQLDFNEYKRIAELNKVNLLSEIDKEHLRYLWSKTNYWAKETLFDTLDLKKDDFWQNFGYVKKYSWARIYNSRDEDKLIYFTLGFEYTGKLIYKLDCQRSKKMKDHLSPEQVERFDSLVESTSAYRNEISYDEIDLKNWDQLIDTTRSFVRNNLDLYQDVIDYVWNFKTINSFTQDFQFSSKPEIPLEFQLHLPAFKTVSNSENPDYTAQHKTSKRLGDLGENFVLSLETYKLSTAGIEATPKRMKDGDGYDFESFDTDGNKIYIEVKTTTGGITSPFFISDNEMQFLKDTNNAIIYRVFNFDPQNMNGEIFKLTYQDLIQYNKKAQQYKVYLK